MSRLCIYYRPLAERDRWVRGDRFVRPLIRRLVRGKPRPGGVDKVFLNLCLGLDRIGYPYIVNLPFRKLRPTDRVAVLGRERAALAGYDRPNPIVAGIGMMTHPEEWPELCDEYPVVAYLSHCDWVNDLYRTYFGERCRVWPVGIDTDTWAPAGVPKEVDFLVYDKIRWERERYVPELLAPITRELRAAGLTFEVLRYGHYEPAEFQRALARSRAMIFLAEHESQGLAYQECMASGVPVFAWDPGLWLDPNRFGWGTPHVPATSVPYFDERCGLRFREADEFRSRLPYFLECLAGQGFAPRDYVLQHLTLEDCARDFVRIVDEATAGTTRPALADLRSPASSPTR